MSLRIANAVTRKQRLVAGSITVGAQHRHRERATDLNVIHKPKGEHELTGDQMFNEGLGFPVYGLLDRSPAIVHVETNARLEGAEWSRAIHCDQTS